MLKASKEYYYIQLILIQLTGYRINNDNINTI